MSNRQLQALAGRYETPQWSGAPCCHFQIEVRDGDSIQRFNVYEKGVYSFGRDASCDIVLEHESASRFHAVLQFQEGDDSAYIYDLGSTNGTLVNDTQVNKEAYVTLIDGDLISFGKSSRLYQFQAPSVYKHIQETDAPERLQIQLLRSGSTPLDVDSLTSESNWIFDHLTKPWISKTHLANAVKVDDIRRFLVLQHVEKLDLPFIAMYRRENWPSLFKDPDQLEDYPPDQDKSELKWHKILWAIQDLDLEWLMLQKRKRELKDRCQKCFDESRRPHDKMRQSLYKQIFQSSMKFLESANSEREVEDVETKFMFHFNQDVLPLELHNVAEEDIWKQVWEACQYNMKSVYSVCSKAGLWRVACNFGPSSEDLGLQ